MNALSLDHLHKSFGGFTAANGISLTVEEGERRAIIGPNGAGKTTLFNLISGELKPDSGTIKLNGKDVTGHSPDQVSRMGLARTFQRNNLFLGLSVFENVRLAAQSRAGISNRLFSAVSRFKQVNALALSSLERAGILDKKGQMTRNLSYGDQRALEIAVALATQPHFLMLDEPSAGMSPAETTSMTSLIASMPRDLTILIIEHDMDLVFSIAERITVLHYGEVIAEGTPEQVKSDRRVLEVYLGEGVAQSVGD